MKRRVLVAVCALSVALPSLMADVGAGSSLLSGSIAFAQPAATDPITEAARAKYQEGVRAFEAGKYEDARSAFLQAYALKRVPAVLLNLGQSELKAGHPEDAGNHLQQFIREHKTAKPEEITSAQNGIADAKKKTGHLIVIVNAVGADLSVDGTSIGKSPLLDPYFVKPGKHTLYATYQGQAATTTVDVKKGIATSATLTLNVATPAPTTPPITTAQPPPTTPPPVYTAPPPTTSAPPGSTAPAPTYPYPGSTAPYIPPAQNDPLAPPSATSISPDQPTGTREPIFDWFKRKPVAWIGVGVTGVGLIMGIGFSAAAAGASGNVNNYADQIASEAAKDGVSSPCGKEDDPSDDLAKYNTACETLRSSLSQYRTDVAVAATGWVLFGLGAIGTAVYTMIDWYPKRTTAAAQGPQILGITPVVSPTQGGLGVFGRF